jgi:uncharacterized repeat protein (TIGR01451 family)
MNIKSKYLKHCIAYLAAVSFGLALILSPIVSKADTGLTVQPVKVLYTINPGQTVTGTITLTNAGSSQALVTPTVQDFVPLANSTNISFVGKAPGVTSVEDWVGLTVPPQGFELNINETRQINFTITAPKDAEPGSHFGVILFRATDASNASQALKVGTQVGVLVLVTIPGNHLEQGKIGSFKTAGFVQKGPISFDLLFENTGTAYFQPQGTVTIKNIFGRVVGTAPVNGQIVLPTGSRDINISWPANFLLGPYTASVSVYNSGGDLIGTANARFFALPIWYIVSAIIVLIALYLIFVFLKKKVNFSVSLKK